MPTQRRFRILTPDGLLSRDTFVLPVEQPRTIMAGCVLVVHEGSGRLLTVHDTRLFPAEAAESIAVVGAPKSVCLTCGRVEGVIQEQVVCPNHDGGSCCLVESNGARTPAPLFASHGGTR